MLTRLRSNEERGAVMIVVAVALPVIAIMVSLAINVAHWYDYSRNLQLRADAAALAAGDSYGAICANPNPAAMDSIGKTAQLYAGPLSDASDVYYPYGTTPTDLAALGQTINGTAGSNGYFNIPNLKAGTARHYHVILNSDRYWKTGDTSAGLSFNMGSVCNATDGTDTGPMVDVRVTQDSLPLFMPFLGLTSTLNAHARVAAQGIGIANNLKPLGVRDPGATPCLRVTFTPTGGGTTQSFELTLNQALSGATQIWDNGNGTNVTMPPAGSNFVVSVTEHSQGADNTCNTISNPITYDKLLLVNTYGGATAPDPGGFVDPNQDGATTGGGWTKVPPGAPSFTSLVDDGVRQPAAPVTNTDQMTNTSTGDTSPGPGQAFGFPNSLTFKAGDTYTLWVYGNTNGSSRRGVKFWTSTNDGTSFSATGTTIISANQPNGWYSQPITITSQAQLDGLQIRLTNERTQNGSTSTGTATVDEIYVQRSPAAGGGPKLVGDANGGGVTLLTNNGCTPDQYLSTSAGCGVQVCAIVQFDNGATGTGVSVNGAAMNPSNAVTDPNALCRTTIAGATAWISNVINVPQLSGIHQMNLAWTETVAGGVPGQNCTGAGVCTGTFGVEQQAFAACDGDTGTVVCPADNSGPVVRAEIGEGLVNNTIGSFQGGSTHQLVVRIDLQGLSDALPTDRCPNQCTLMRFGTGNTDGSVDCGTGNSTANVRNAMINGCPQFGDPRCADAVFCAPFTKSPDGTCNNLTRTSGFAVDCIDSNNNGATIPECVGALIQVGGRQVGGGDPCDFNNNTGCAVNHWALGDPIVGGDPRIITTFIVYPGDLSGATGNTRIPIRLFASFYVTGWQDQGNGKTIQCPNTGPQANEPAPAGASKAAIWGHWITYTEPNAGGDGKPCNFQAFGDCAVVLTR